MIRIIEKENTKCCSSKYYNYIFNKQTGYFIRWGETLEDDPLSAPSPEILDLEISAGNVGTEEQMCKGKCPFCYKGNNQGNIPIHNMTLDEFKNIFHKINKNKTLLQIAFGIMNVTTNPDFFAMMKYAKQNGVIPNYTCHGLDVTNEIAKKTSELCGAVAVSIVNKEKTYDAIKKFSIDNNMSQTNIHYMLAKESYDKAFDIIDDITTDDRLKNLNAIVFLQYKHKNKESNFHSVLDIDKYQKLIEYCNNKSINYGFDSCSAPIYVAAIENDENKKQLEVFCESCEATCFSSYINCYGAFFPCSFCEEEEWKNGLDVLNCDNFIKDIWNHSDTLNWRNKLLNSIDKNNCRNCPVYDLDYKKETINV